MEFEMREIFFKDFITLKRGYDLPTKKRISGTIPIVSSSGITGIHNEFKVQGPGVITGRSGLIGETFYTKQDFWPLNTTLYVKDFKNNSPEYVYYFLKTLNLSNYQSGSSVPTLNRNHLDNVEIKVHDIADQIKISNILSKIDEKVDVNNKIIANLEELSQTLFKHWFIDFEFPDKNGNPYKSSGGEFITSELGDIPKGWEIKKLDEIATHKKESFNPKKEEAQTVAHFSLPAFDTDQMPVMDFSKDIKSNKWLINKDTILFSKMNPRTMRVWLPSIREELTNIASTEFVVLECDNDNVKSLIYNLSSTNIFKDFLLSNATGSTNSRQRVRPNIAVSFKLAFNDQIIKLYGQRVNSLMSKIISLRDENIYLNEIRDALLPKLMSGELELPDTLEV